MGAPQVDNPCQPWWWVAERLTHGNPLSILAPIHCFSREAGSVFSSLICLKFCPAGWFLSVPPPYLGELPFSDTEIMRAADLFLLARRQGAKRKNTRVWGFSTPSSWVVLQVKTTVRSEQRPAAGFSPHWSRSVAPGLGQVRCGGKRRRKAF